MAALRVAKQTPGQLVGQGYGSFDSKYGGGGGSAAKGEDTEKCVTTSFSGRMIMARTLTKLSLFGDRRAAAAPTWWATANRPLEISSFILAASTPPCRTKVWEMTFSKSHRATTCGLTAYNDKDARFKAADFALERAAKNGWGDWANSAHKSGLSTTAWRDHTPAEKPTTTTAKASETPPADTAKYGGPNAKTSTGEVVHTDAEGRAIDPKTGKPTQAQADTPQSDRGVQVASLDDTGGAGRIRIGTAPRNPANWVTETKPLPVRSLHLPVLIRGLDRRRLTRCRP